MIKKLLIHIPAALVLSVSIFYVSLLIHFPTQALEDRMEYEVQKQSKQAYFLDIGSTAIKGVGLALSDIKILEKERRSEEANLLINAEQVQVSLPIFSLLTMSPAASISSDIFGGEIHVFAKQEGKGNLLLKSEASDLNLALLPTKGAAWSLDFLGQLKLDSNLKFPIKRFAKAKGNLSLSAQNAKLDGGTILINTLPEIDFKEVAVEFEFAKGKASVTKGIIESDALSVAIDGYIKLSNQPLKSKMFLKLKVTTGEEIDTLLGSIAAPYKGEDGSFTIKVLGPLQSPRVQPISPRKKRRDRPKRNTRSNTPEPEMTPSAGGPNFEEKAKNDEASKRRKERLERAKKRRQERLKKDGKLGKRGLERILPSDRIRPNIPALEEEGEEESDDEESDDEESDDEESDDEEE